MANLLRMSERIPRDHGYTYAALDHATSRTVWVREFRGRGLQFGFRELEVTSLIPRSECILSPISHVIQDDGSLCLLYDWPTMHTLDSVIARARIFERAIIPPIPPFRLTAEYVRVIASECCSVVEYLHAHGVTHRCIHPGSFLIGGGNEQASQFYIWDFRSARLAGPGPQTPPTEIYSPSRHYRAPELLMGSHLYTGAGDIWSLGLTLAALVDRTDLFPRENSDIDQLRTIFQVLGFPSEDERNLLPNVQWNELGAPRGPRRPMAELLPTLNPAGVDLISRMLEFVPERRISAADALEHPYLVGMF